MAVITHTELIRRVAISYDSSDTRKAKNVFIDFANLLRSDEWILDGTHRNRKPWCWRNWWHSEHAIRLITFEDFTRVLTLYNWPKFYGLFSCDQAALRTILSVRPSVWPSVTAFWQWSCHRIILKFSGLITIDRRDVHAKGQCQRSVVKVTQVVTPFSRFRTVTPVWIHIWRWYGAQSLMLLRRDTLLFSKVIRKISGHTAKQIVDFDANWAFPDWNSSLNSQMAMKWCTNLKQHSRIALLFFKVIRQISRSHETYQNQRVLNQPILRPLWLMTSAWYTSSNCIIIC